MADAAAGGAGSGGEGGGDYVDPEGVEPEYVDGSGAPEGEEGGEYVDEEYDEDDEEMIRNIGEHELMAPVQEALYKQLTRKHEGVSLELRENEEALSRVRKRREDVGVELYGVQQQLAKLQMQLETTHNNCNLIAGIRKKFEEDVAGYQKAYTGRKREIVDEESKLERAKSELDELNSTLRQVERYNEEMKSEIAVTRRATYKAEENVEQLEAGKKKQDFYIDTLTEELKRLHEQLALLEAQISSQREETTSAADTLKEAAAEMETISFEKKQLLQQWKSSLIGMQRRDEALQATNEALRKQKEAELSIDTETDGYRASIAKEQLRSATLHEVFDKVDNETKYLEGQLETMARQRDALAERYSMLKKSLDQTDAEVRRLKLEQENIVAQRATLEQNRETVDRERRALEDAVAANKSTQTTVSKAARNLAKEAAKVQSVIHEKEMERATMENEAARIRVDALNTEAHNSQLREGLEKYVTELREKDRLVEKYEMEIRQRNDEIEKKMYLVDRLNRKFEALTANVEDENMGPLEATIKNLGKNISQTQAECETLQKRWLRQQTMLVDAANVVETDESSLHEQKARYVLLDQKRIRLDSQIEMQEKEVAQLRAAINGMHTDMTRLNTLIAKNESLHKRLADTNFAMEREFIASLREMEEDSVRAERDIVKVKEEKARMLDEIMETERQVMLWEKKIQLEKETQEALDPEVGQAESASMEKEIHRMKLRYETLKRDQERMIKEMERAIAKREAISTRFKGKKHGSSAEPTRAGLRKRLASLTQELKAAAVDTAGYEQAIRVKLDEMDRVSREVEEKSSTYSQLEDSSATLQRAINAALYDKQRGIEALTAAQRMAGRYDALAKGRRPPVDPSDGPAVEKALDEASTAQQNIRGMITDLSKSHPAMEEVLERVAQLTEI